MQRPERDEFQIKRDLAGLDAEYARLVQEEDTEGKVWADRSEFAIDTVAEGATWIVESVVPLVGKDLSPWWQVKVRAGATPADLAEALEYVHGYRMMDFDGEVMFFEAA